ncbi:hypothetical protein IFM89_015506 [Coptis chinensis]|uniref:Uncharacterized protein n=1 Tax=Coptis chinensis TaxID=261450 RepID=A0A835GWN1_9MAGN|nr:hypothetical protein IFM89_015506 [Coptis chinensis]
MNLGVRRKGAWSQEEDLLLRKCVESKLLVCKLETTRLSTSGCKKNLVEFCNRVSFVYNCNLLFVVVNLAGLNRCRKSCRLRWLNYLRPNIKRGGFKEDENDLIIKLHKLLGNRQVTILPVFAVTFSRTANDIKNYWNSHLSRKLEVHPKLRPKLKRTEVIRPQPRTFDAKSNKSRGLSMSNNNQQQQQQQQQIEKSDYLMPSEEKSMWLNSLEEVYQSLWDGDVEDGLPTNSMMEDSHKLDGESTVQWDEFLSNDFWSIDK